jgi:hypothetical protein
MLNLCHPAESMPTAASQLNAKKRKIYADFGIDEAQCE